MRMRVIGPGWRRRHMCRGLTLLECTLALVIVPMAVTAVVMAVVAGQAQAAESLRQTRGAMLGEALMEQALALDYDEISGFCGSFSESPGTLKDPHGVIYPAGLQAFQRTLTCTPEDLTMTFDNGDTFTTAGLRITVTVKHRDTPIVTLRRFVPSSE